MPRVPRVLVGMSGGVDSSVAAALLVEAGFDVCGAYMKNWTLDVGAARCPWADDLAYAKRTAVRLGIDFTVYDFQEAYKREVVDYLVGEYAQGRTPNPDVMCNQEVKFGLFLERALADGFDFIATGHYARTGFWSLDPVASERDGSAVQVKPSVAPAELAPSRGARLLLARDTAKDQTYFLYRMSQQAVDRTLFPLGRLTKAQVRSIARNRDLPSASKADSQGICFVGEARIRDFLGLYVHPVPGPTVDADSGQVVGYHDGAIFFTIGQRKGLGTSGGTDPYYVVGKDMEANAVYVSRDRTQLDLRSRSLEIRRLSWIAESPPAEGACLVRTRHTGALQPACVEFSGPDAALIRFDEPLERVAPGQSAVLYRDGCCLGGGIVAG